MAYLVKEIFYTLQGEGLHAGKPAVFCRFSGCNLWSGREEDRKSAICKICDTDFVGTNGHGGGIFEDAASLAHSVNGAFPKGKYKNIRPFVVCTGGEPLLQLDMPLLEAFHDRNIDVAVETNGTYIPPKGIDWVCVSPKKDTELIIKSGNELKLLYPQEGFEPEMFEKLSFDFFYLQPIYSSKLKENTLQAIEYCLHNPQWRLSLQMHKILGLTTNISTILKGLRTRLLKTLCAGYGFISSLPCPLSAGLLSTKAPTRDVFMKGKMSKQGAFRF